MTRDPTDPPSGKTPEQTGPSGFRVTDKRRLDPATGEARPANERDSGADEIQLPGGGVLRPETGPAEGGDDVALPAQFEDLVRPFLLMGLTSLGLLPHPDTGEATVSVATARTAIGTLEMLKAKTEGNRSDAETKLLEEALFELRMQFVAVRDKK